MDTYTYVLAPYAVISPFYQSRRSLYDLTCSLTNRISRDKVGAQH